MFVSCAYYAEIQGRELTEIPSCTRGQGLQSDRLSLPLAFPPALSSPSPSSPSLSFPSLSLSIFSLSLSFSFEFGCEEEKSRAVLLGAVELRWHIVESLSYMESSLSSGTGHVDKSQTAKSTHHPHKIGNWHHRRRF